MCMVVLPKKKANVAKLSALMLITGICGVRHVSMLLIGLDGKSADMIIHAIVEGSQLRHSLSKLTWTTVTHD